MSGLAAVLLTGERGPAGSHLHDLHVMSRASAHRAADGVDTWSDDRVALALLRHARFGGAPRGTVHRGPLALTFDGRLDNGGDLAGDLLSDGESGDDAQLVAAALEAWGPAAIERLEGDFAFVAWNAREEVLFAGRDRVGIRPLHWSLHGGRLYCASDIAQIVAVIGTPAPDETAVADLLAGEPPADDRTLFRGVHRVPGGAMLQVRSAQPTLTRYWNAEPAPSGAQRSDDDWASECRELMERSIRQRMRGPSPTAVYFSGGVDSSVLLTLATGIARREHLPAPLPVTVVFTNPETDESGFRDAVATRLGCRVRPAYPLPIDAGAYRAQAARRFTLPDLPADASSAGIRRVAQEGGARAGLSGAGPDTLFSGSVLHYADLIGRGSLIDLARRVLIDRQVENTGWSRSALLTSGLWPLLPAPQRRWLRAPARRVSGIANERSWLRLAPTGRDVVPDPPPGVPHATWEITCSLRDGWTPYFIESAERSASEASFEDRYPFMDGRMIAFALSLPEDQRRRGAITKFVFRSAVPELAPEVAARLTKADFGHLLAGSLAALGGPDFFATLAIAEAGWVEPGELARRYDRTTRTTPDDVRTGRDLPMLWMIAATELWFRSCYGTGARGAQSA
jgi:asparagine synthase (glutamine-hydrolysing)